MVFPEASGLSIQMSAFSSHLKDFAEQKHHAVWNGFINVDRIQNTRYTDNLRSNCQEKLFSQNIQQNLGEFSNFAYVNKSSICRSNDQDIAPNA